MGLRRRLMILNPDQMQSLGLVGAETDPVLKVKARKRKETRNSRSAPAAEVSSNNKPPSHSNTNPAYDYRTQL